VKGEESLVKRDGVVVQASWFCFGQRARECRRQRNYACGAQRAR
jgi:hypothetical protein